ncbi:ATPase [Paenibacillus darwinianus]|uniref:Copper-exporting P-type ATPase n=1 Tax=Paenibacillus darwinianus TaxID=1380763 RepID=A0A9W5S205_9BACL|nr:heavy metal translocating P-type ATPase [Paenibacillus darwinianus]EXX88891.1 ATPase [Paenibacillus darwinianus]EXX89103.1 ATPase [Paenibacillus darwinianus]EXX90434.1 ATPase [Paenibacillus darwinianus]
MASSCCNHEHNDGQRDLSRHTSQTASLTGLHCGDCAVKLEKVISRIDGVSSIDIHFATSKMSVGYDESRTDFETVVSSVRKLGYDVAQPATTNPNISTFRIEGMDCADCAQKLEKRVGAISSVVRVNVNFGAAKMTVEHDGNAVEAVRKAVKQAGYSATEQKEGAARREAEQPFWKKNKKVLTTAISGLLFLLAWIPSLMGMMEESTASVLYAAAIVVGGYRIAKSGIYGLRSRTVGMDFLMMIAAVGAAVIGQWGEGAAVVFLFALGETLEAYTMDRTRNSIRSLMDLAPNEAIVRRSGQTMTLPVEQIVVGDILMVRPGEKIAMDGKVAKGFSAVNQAPITGESIPVEKAAGDDVFAGTVNQQGALEIEVTKLSKDNTLSRIIHLVEEAQAQKAPSQRFVDVFSKYYTPAVIAVAVGIATIPTLIFGQPFDIWFYRALMMLVVSCPCALVISTPVSIVSAIGNAARNGILIKGGAHLERLGAITVIAFDKTGTLTAGVPQVEEIIPLCGRPLSDVLATAASVESMSEHPVAEAIVRKATQEGIGISECTNFTSITGKGAQAEIDGMAYRIGNPRWFRDDLHFSLESIQEELDRLQQTGRTVMLLGTDEQLLAIITVADQIRANSRAAIAELQAVGMKKIVMLTGDNQGTAKAVAAKLGGIDYRAELLPQDKVSSIKEWMKHEKGVAMVGDGVNDAPALATATVGIAMGAAGTDTALETADVALMADDLAKLPYAVRLSRRALRIIKQNIAFSLLVKAVFMALIFMGWSTLWMAVLADTGSSLLVIANGMRLLGFFSR